MRPKYSIVLPTLNGKAALEVILPAMLRQSQRSDVEWVVSDNCSEDGGYPWLLGLAERDPRLRPVRPARRLNIGEHLDFAYSQAVGEWQSHLGDDDFLTPWRFDQLDRVIDAHDPQMIRGGFVRYVWPAYPDRSRENSLDPKQSFDCTIHVHGGAAFARQALNDERISPGGCWVVRREVIEAVRRRCGFYSSSQHVEFFAKRAAMCLSERVATTELPVMIYGQHEKSSTTQCWLPARLLPKKTWDWSVEDPERYRHSPFQWKSHNTLSLDAALMVREKYPEILGDTPVDWLHWCKAIHKEMLVLRAIGQCPPDAERRFNEIIANLPVPGMGYWSRRKSPRLLRPVVRVGERLFKGISSATGRRRANITTGESRFGWQTRVDGRAAHIQSIVDVPGWVERLLPRRLLGINAPDGPATLGQRPLRTVGHACSTLT